ncbi:hypothetical protein HF086_016461, partial [Spodoptera exigua]
MLAFPSVLTPALVSNSSDIIATPDQASWIAACNGLAGMCGFFILSPILQISGRKLAHISCNLPLLIGWVILTLANSIQALFAARIIQGLAIGGIYINSIIIGEYVDFRRRGCFLTIKKIAIGVGILVCHSSSLFLDWRQISMFAICLPTIGVILTLFWPESPSYLAMKGRFEECERSFIWLHGHSNLKELEHILSNQMKNKPETSFRFLIKKDFLKPILIVSLLTLLLDLCGRYYFVVYVIEIMVELIGDQSLATYCSIGADLLTVIAFTSSCFIINRYKRRTILFVFGALTVFLMFSVSLLMLLKHYKVGTNIVFLTPSFIIMQCVVVNFGLIPVSFTLIGEVFPLRYKGYSSCVSGIVFTFLYTLTLKLTPILMENTGIGGAYAIYGLSMGVSLMLLYFVVPETKDKTLQEIEDYNYFERNKLFCKEQKGFRKNININMA